MLSLSKYNKKRNFNKTSEPKGSKKKKYSGKPIFVIQKHDATNLHYDFRLEIDGTLKSWAIPKGPSTDPSVKRMAIPTEDHPMAYAQFEGTIPKGEYGGGTVMIWDKGRYSNLKKDENNKPVSLSKSYQLGRLEFWLEGEKLKGGYALVKMKSSEVKGNWLLIKMKDEQADARRNPINTQTKSVKSGKSMKEISEEE